MADLFFILSGLVLAHAYGRPFARTPCTIGYGRFLLAAAHPCILYLATLLLLVGWDSYKAPLRDWLLRRPLFKMREWRDALLGSPLPLAEALPSSLLLLQVVTDHGIDLELRRLVAQRGVD